MRPGGWQNCRWDGRPFAASGVTLQGEFNIDDADGDLANDGISDDALEQIKGLTQLTSLDLTGTDVTEEGAKQLEQALPDCQITR